MFIRTLAPSTLLVLFSMGLFGAVAAASQGGPSVARPAEPIRLATGTYASAQGTRSVTVWRRDLESTPAATLQYLKAHPEKTALPNVVLYATDSPIDSTTTARVVWASYDYFASNMRPWPSWSADVAVHPLTKQIYVTVMKTTSMRAALSLYEIAMDASLAPYPPTFTAANVEQWPEAPRPVATLQKDTPDEACTPASIGTIPTSQGLLMSVMREPGRCASVTLEYEARSKAWHDVTVVTPR